MCSFKSIYFVIFILNLYETHAEISDKRLCADSQCNEPLSAAKTLLRYSSPDPRILSFAPNAEVTIYSKEAGSETTLWGATIKGKRGYVPKHLVREYKIYKKPTLLVDTELKQSSQVPNEPDQNIDPNSVKKSYEVVDGTTIYLNPQDVNPSTTESPILSTSLPTDNATEQQTVSVDDSKEKIDPKKETKQESIVDSVLSSFSNFMDDENDSEEIDAEDDDEDDEDEEDEEESIEDNTVPDKKTPETAPDMAQDINSLHNLPQGINVSPYSLDIEQPLNGTIEMSTEDDSKEAHVDPKPSPSDKVEKVDPAVEKTEEVLSSDKNVTPDPTTAPISTNNKEKPATEAKETEEVPPASKIETVEMETVSESTESSETVKEDTKPAEKTEELNTETKNTADVVSEKTEASIPVTEPSIVPEQEQFPILEEVTTSSSLEVEQGSTKTEESNVDPSPKESEENSSAEVDSTAASNEIPSEVASEQKITLEDPATVSESNPSSSENTEGNPSPSEVNEIKNVVPLPPLSLFTPTLNVPVQEESKETVQEDKTPDESINTTNSSTEQQEVQGVGSKEAPENIPKEEVAESSENEVKNIEEGQIENDLVPEAVPTVSSSEEIIQSSLEQEINVDDTKIEEETKSDSNEEPQSDGTSNFAEIQEESPQEPSEPSGGIWSGLFSFFGGGSEESVPSTPDQEIN